MRKTDIAIVILLVLIAGLEIGHIALTKTKRYEKEIYLIKDGKIKSAALEEAELSIEKLSALARQRGYFNLGDIDIMLLERDGGISILPKPRARALNTKDFNFTPVREGVPIVIAKDGKIIGENLKAAGVNEKELLTLLETRGRQLSEILLATITESGRVDVFEK